jgi:hypothetical protein
MTANGFWLYELPQRREAKQAARPEWAAVDQTSGGHNQPIAFSVGLRDRKFVDN